MHRKRQKIFPRRSHCLALLRSLSKDAKFEQTNQETMERIKQGVNRIENDVNNRVLLNIDRCVDSRVQNHAK